MARPVPAEPVDREEMRRKTGTDEIPAVLLEAAVVDRGRVCGVVTAGDVATALADGHDVTETVIGVIASAHPAVVRADDALADAHLRMRAEGRSVAPVVGPGNEPVGVLVDHEAH